MTLLELLVVVTLMGILSAVIVGRYGRDIFGDFGARSDARQLWLDLEVARRMAIRDGAEYSVLFSGPSSGPWSGYSIVRGTPAEAQSGRATATSAAPQDFAEELSVTGNTGVVGFDFEGHASTAGQWVLAGPHRTLEVRVIPLGGAATVTEK